MQHGGGRPAPPASTYLDAVSTPPAAAEGPTEGKPRRSLSALYAEHAFAFWLLGIIIAFLLALPSLLPLLKGDPPVRLGQTVALSKEVSVRVDTVTCNRSVTDLSKGLQKELAEATSTTAAAFFKGQICIAELTVRNTGNEGLDALAVGGTLFVDENEFEPHVGEGKGGSNPYLFPGQSITTNVVFDVPPGVNPSRLQLWYESEADDDEHVDVQLT